ncbi:MAG: acyl-CoA thioesterase [Anaerolineae bacterium]|nr:acyl-CoA thioesterase [Anaerolineae bacterium]
MPATFTATFQIRHYECDAYGHLNNANYARYMEEAAFEASASVGYDKARYEALGYMWLAHETEIEYLRPVKYGDTLAVKTWVGDFRRVRSRRFYEFRKPGEDELVARASTDWVYLETSSGRPSIVPPEMISAFVPEGIEGHTPMARERFPAPPPPPPGLFTMRRRVEWRDIDTAQHVNNAVYFNYIEEAGVQVSRAHGWPMERSMAAGFAVIARQHHIEYRIPALLGDELEIATWVALDGRATANRFYTIKRVQDDVLLAQARTRWVWVDLHTQRPIRIPAEFINDFADNIAHAEPE